MTRRNDEIAAKGRLMRFHRAYVPAVLLLILGIAILRVMPVMSPIREGNSARFWYCACQVDLTGSERERSYFGGVYPPRDGWLIYYDQSIHDQTLFRIRPANVMDDWPAVRNLLETRPPEQDIPEYVLTGFARLKQAADSHENDVEGLLASIRASAIAALTAKGADSLEYFLWGERLFEQRWESYKRYALNALFEFVWLGGLIVFILWPWLRRNGWRAWTIHMSTAPMLFFAPYFLGYAWTTFLSRGPSGGILYPWLIFPFRSWNSWWGDADELVFAYIPQILEPLSQPLGPFMAISRIGGVGPVSILTISIGIALLLNAVRWIVRQTACQPQSCHPSGS